MASASDKAGAGISFTGALTIVFVVLKLTDVIAWSWVWVLSPLWIPFALAASILLFIGIAMVIGSLVVGQKL